MFIVYVVHNYLDFTGSKIQNLEKMLNELKQTLSIHTHLSGLRVKEVPSKMPSNVKRINELTSVHKTIKADPYEDIFYCAPRKNEVSVLKIKQS